MSELQLRVFKNRSELVLPDGTTQVFLEGGMNQSAKLRYQKITGELSSGYLEKQIIRIVEGIETNEIAPEPALHYLLSQLLNRANTFRNLASQTIETL